MTLKTYRHKRSFDSTPEPKAGKSDSKKLRFVVQKHDASHLHYDFRLEMNGVLKSWAVPKGPSMNPADKRLAMMVEDHPYDYKNFEGIIPKGNYGAGTVIIWDQGYYAAIDGTKSKDRQEKSLIKQLNGGAIKFKLSGKKLRGEFALVKTRAMGENAWLLIKHKDLYASTTDITQKDKSVVSGKTIAAMQKEPSSPKTISATKTPVKKKIASPGVSTQKDKKNISSDNSEKTIASILKKAPVSKFPQQITPMLATLVDASFNDEDWEFEVKWDGYRALGFKKGKVVNIISRNNKSYNTKFYPVFDALKNWKIDVVVDGEVVIIDDNNVSRFNKLQNWQSEEDGRLQYYIFDVLWYEGHSLLEIPLRERMRILKAILPPNNTIIRPGFSIREKGIDFFSAAKKLGLEGIIAKRLDSTYIPGNRSKDWLKIKVEKRQEVIIIGFTQIPGSPKPFSSLLMAVYDKGKLRYAGKVGTGFTDAMQQEMLLQFKSLIVQKSPLQASPNKKQSSNYSRPIPGTKITWLYPKLVAEIGFAEITEDGIFRHPSFKGMREDKPGIQVNTEEERPISSIIQPQKNTMKNKAEIVGKIKSTGKKQSGAKKLLDTNEKTQTKNIRGKSLTFTNIDKVFWSKEKITKGDLLNYYHEIAPYILPYIKNRPQSLYRFPDGINGKSFYQKDVTGKVPGWIKTYAYHSEESPVKKHFLVAEDEASLLFMVNFGCIEINPWSSTIKTPDNPDWCLLDLDPGSKISFNQVIEVANQIHDLLESISVPSFPKTSGSTGMHIYIPLGRKYSYDQSKEFARLIVTIVQQNNSNYTSIERQVEKRKGKLYLDFLQNRPQATLAAPYSVRPKPGATVSMPVDWGEVKKGLSMKDFTLQNTVQMLATRGDIFKDVLGKGINMPGVLKALTAIRTDQ